MTAHTYTEDQLVERPAIGLFAELGWQTVSAMEEVFGQSGTLGRETSGDVVLVPKLRAALERLNLQLPAETCLTAAHARTRDSLLPWLGLHRIKPAVLKSQLS
jgi:type I restriction enzyme, R subunit